METSALRNSALEKDGNTRLQIEGPELCNELSQSVARECLWKTRRRTATSDSLRDSGYALQWLQIASSFRNVSTLQWANDVKKRNASW